MMKILRLLFSPEDARLARRLPGQLTPLGRLSKRLRIPRRDLQEKLDNLARRGLVVDLKHKGRRYFTLAPVVIGFFELTFMRVRDDVPMKELARLFEQYMDADDRFTTSVLGRGRTQLSRSLVREEALPQSSWTECDHTEILDWERASRIVQSSRPIAVSLCPCRHKESHLGKACDGPQRVCLSLNYAAESVIRNGIAEAVTVGQAMQILEECKRAALAQTGDNVQRKMSYICNCCGCCCEMVRAIKSFGLRGAIVTSNWIMAIDAAKCKGCGKCVQACPVDAIEVIDKSDGPGPVPLEDGKEEPQGEKRRKWAVCDGTLCLGCGVCYAACKSDAIVMQPRPKRVFTPETVFDRVVAMAIERGKLAELLFDNRQKLSHRALARIVGAIEKSPPLRAAMAIKPLRSAFLNRIVAAAKRQAGEMRGMFE